MDSITHIVLGASIGEIIAGKRIGKKAMLVGAAIQSLPDIDFFAALWMTPSQYFLAHRGFTHSLVFIAIVSVLLSLVINNFNSLKVGFRYWGIFLFIQLLIHLLLDSLNAYGVGWFEPFSHLRISYDVLFVADPFFTIWLAIACLVLLILPTQSPLRVKWAIAGILVSAIYTCYSVANKSIINSALSKSFELQRISPVKILATPTPLNTWLWYVVAEANDGFFIGYHSVFDRSASVAYQYFPKNDSLINRIRKEKETQQLIRLARGFYIIEKHHDTLIFDNLRFGQMNGWENAKAGFVFQYQLEKPNSLFTVQQGRFSGWNQKTTSAFIKRIQGN